MALVSHQSEMPADTAYMVSRVEGLESVSTWDQTGVGYMHTFQSCICRMIDAKNIAVGTTTGTQIGTAATQKFGFSARLQSFNRRQYPHPLPQ